MCATHFMIFPKRLLEKVKTIEKRIAREFAAEDISESLGLLNELRGVVGP